mgnify:CR=1 FL=1
MDDNQGYFTIRVFWLWVGIVMSSAISVSMYVMGREDSRPSDKPATLIQAPPVDTRTVRIDPAGTRCRAQPYGTKQDGWSRLRTQDEAHVEALVKRGMAEKTAPQTLLCRDPTQKPLVEFSLRETWWRKLPRPQQYQNQACGDYTRPEVPYPVVVGV